MTVIELIKKLRVNTKVEIRINNFKVVCVEKDHISMVNKGLLCKEVDNWGVDSIGRSHRILDKIFIDVKGE